MLRGESILKTLVMVVLFTLALISFSAAAQAMPAQVIIIRHADKPEDPHLIHLTPKGYTRAKALSQFFQSDPRVLEFGRPAAIIAMSPTPEHGSVRSLETVQPLARDLGLKVISQFTHSQPLEMVNWLKAQKQFDGTTVLIAWNHMEIPKIAQALGVSHLRPRIWPHETYDRFWLLKFSPQDGRVTSFRNLPQSLLFGDSYQAASLKGLTKPDTASFKQVYSEKLGNPSDGRHSWPPVWKFQFAAQVQGDFSRYTDETIPVLRIGGFCFGYYLTTLGYLKKDENASVHLNAAEGSGTLVYNYKAAVGRAPQTYARVSFTWNKQALKVEFQADVDENKIKSEIDVPVEVGNEKPEGLIIGAAPCYLAFGDQKFQAPAGLTYQGWGKKSKGVPNQPTYTSTVEAPHGILMEKKD